eukprot:8677251-Alexandrium_andersonii.AAC.1
MVLVWLDLRPPRNLLVPPCMHPNMFQKRCGCSKPRSSEFAQTFQDDGRYLCLCRSVLSCVGAGGIPALCCGVF